ncbi:serine protease inhibitor swm-1-like [Dendropsophus ebraccatus]|uniref:serine protease inhibitor swm-1-like n=1 Tax=Dendropsophus ebraccatus TaxID=150705 RepID=UPI003831FD3E
MEQRSVILLSSLSALLMLISVQAAKIGYGTKPCTQGKEYNRCGSSCKPSCDGETACLAKCEQGCYCPAGTLEDGDGKCVKKADYCKGNMTYADCGNDCGHICPSRFHKRFVCPKTHFPGCFCNSGYVHLGDRCVLPQDCPKLLPFPRPGTSY